MSTLTYYIAFLTKKFNSARSVRNYISGIRTLHKQMCLDPPSLNSFPVHTLLRAADLSMRTPPNRRLPITPRLLAQLCELCKEIGAIGPSLRVALTFGFFGMLRQSNLAPASMSEFDPTRHTCRADIIITPPGLAVILKWTKTLQVMDKTPLVAIPQLQGQATDPLAAYKDLLAVSPTTKNNQPLLTMVSKGKTVAVTSGALGRALRIMVAELGYDTKLYSLHSLRRGGATAAYRDGVDTLDIKRHGTWSSDAFWQYVTAPCVAQSPVAASLAATVSAVSTT